MAVPAAVRARVDLGPAARRAISVAGVLAGAYLYKHANRLWPFLIRRRLVHAAWRPLVELARRRHMAARRRLLRAECTDERPATLGRSWS